MTNHYLQYLIPVIPTGHHIMSSLANWASLVVAIGVLLSPVIAFLLAICVEILVGLVKDGGAPVVFVLAVAGVIGGILYGRRRASRLVGDQA
jgi:hypothetical protein